MINMNPSEFIRSASPGTMILTQGESEGQIETCVLARGASTDIPRETTRYQFGMRAAVFHIGPILLLPLLLRLHAAQSSRLYEAWINPGPEDGRIYIEDLSRQESLQVHFYGESGCAEKVVLIENTMRTFFQELLEQLEAPPGWAWSREEYDYSVKLFCQRFSKEILWKLIGEVQTTRRRGPSNNPSLQ